MRDLLPALIGIMIRNYDGAPLTIHGVAKTSLIIDWLVLPSREVRR